MFIRPSYVQAGTAVTNRDFRQLRELELMATWPGSPHQILLSSITSTELQKIFFTASHLRDWAIVGWDLIDRSLCGLVDRLRAMGHRHILEVELRVMEIVNRGKYDFTVFCLGLERRAS